jgi:hypothetical protein
MASAGTETVAAAGCEAVAVDGDMGDWTSENLPIHPTPDPDEDTELGLM